MSSSEGPPAPPESEQPRPLFLTDENLAKSVRRALEGLGERVVSMIDRYGRGARDEVWLPDAGAHRLVVLTKDERQKTKPAEKRILEEHRVLHFALSPEHVWLLQDQADAVVQALPEIKRLIRLPSAERGILARIHPGGRVTRLSRSE